MDYPLQGNRNVDIQTSESEQEDLGDEIEEDSSILNSSSDPPARHEVPSVSPGGGYMAGSACHLVCIPPPVLAVCTLVSVRSHLLECAPPRRRQQCLFCGALPTPHPGSRDAWCVTRHCFCPKTAPIIDPKMAVTDQLLGQKSTKPTYAVELGLVGLEVAWHVCHQPEPMTAKEASSLMVTHLKLPPAQELELNSNLQVESFFQDFDKQMAFQQQFEYKRKLLGLLKGIRSSMTPLFALTDKLESFEAKLRLFCGELGITLAELDGDAS